MLIHINVDNIGQMFAVGFGVMAALVFLLHYQRTAISPVFEQEYLSGKKHVKPKKKMTVPAIVIVAVAIVIALVTLTLLGY
jgi:hypothetical protein